MISAVAGAWALLLGIGLLMLGNGLQGSLLGLRATLEGFSTNTTGLVMSGYYVGILAGSTFAPLVVGRVGHIRVFAALATLASAAALLHAVFVLPQVWIGLRVVTGFCYAGLYVVAESWLNDRATNETRGQLLSIYMVIMLGAMALGQFLLNLANPGGFELFILISVLLSCALVPIALTTGRAPAFDAPAQVGLRRLLRISPLGVVGTFGIGIAHGAVFGMGAVYADRMGLAVTEIATFMALSIAGGMALQWPIGRLSDHFDRRRIITVVTFLSAIVALALTMVPGQGEPGFAGIWGVLLHPIWGLFILAALFGGLSLPLYSLFIAHTNDFLEPRQMVAASSSLVLVMGLGSILGPLSAGAAMTLAGAKGFFWCVGLVHAAVGFFALFRMTRRAAVPMAKQSAYVAVAASGSPVAAASVPQVSQDHDHAREQAADPRSEIG